MHVAEHVIAHVEDTVSRNAQMLLHAPSVATEVDAAVVRASDDGPEQSLLVGDLEEGMRGGEERRLAGRHDDEIE